MANQPAHPSPPDLAELCRGLFDAPATAPRGAPVSAEQLPEPARFLLVHDEHMTLRLEQHFGAAVRLRVLADHLEGRSYRRRIVLTPDGHDRIVELGVVRIRLDRLPDAVRGEVLSKSAPLGDILTRHGVMTHVRPQAYYRFDAADPALAPLSAAGGAERFGRVATIDCDGRPAIELLEIIAV
ncbi:MAG: hypothetical protein HUU22_13310 [Phycisphaerae bacterium]|nr:hypothetical protein [Phycisphaerae bacterium]NUQ46998.1 hypothetical protein [Phycisphaerae bacterium]